MNKEQKTQYLDMDNNKDNKKQNRSIEKAEGISRKEAIKKMGKYAAVTAIGSYIILNPLRAQSSSSTPGAVGGGFG